MDDLWPTPHNQGNRKAGDSWCVVSGWGAGEKRDRNAHLSESVNTLACITSRHGEVDRHEGHVGNGGLGGCGKRPLGREQRGTPAKHVHAVTRVSDALQLPSQHGTTV